MSVATPIRPTIATSAFRAPTASKPAAPVFRPSVTVLARPGESPVELRRRLFRAMERLAVVVDAGGHVPARWMLRLERRGGATAMPLPAAAIGGDSTAFARRLPDAALRDVERVVLNVSIRSGMRSYPVRVASAVA